MLEMSPASTEHHSRGRLVALIAVIAIIPFLNSLEGDFTFDDPTVVVNNPVVARSAPLLPVLTTVDARGWPYRPATMLTYWINAQVGSRPFGYHLVNVGLHALVTVEVFFLAVLILSSTVGATVTAVVFAVHPIHTEAVSSVVGRAELLAAALVLASLLASLRAFRPGTRHRALWIVSSLGAFTVALFAKESAFTTIALLGLLHWWVTAMRNYKRLFALLLPYILVAVGYLGLRLFLIGSFTLAKPPMLLDNPLWYASVPVRVGTALVILWQYLAVLAVPLRLSADYSFHQIPMVTSVLDPRFLGATVVFATLAAGLIISVRRAPVLIVAAAFAAFSLALTANVFFPIGTIKAERLLYLPSVGWCLACGWLALRIPPAQRRQWGALATLLLVALAVRTWARNRDWHDDLALFTSALDTSPGSAKVHHNLAVAYDHAHDIDKAMTEYREALAIYPRYPSAAFGIGYLYEQKGLDEGALHWYAKAIAWEPRFLPAYINRGRTLYHVRRYADLEATARAGLEVEPTNPRLLILLGLARLARGDRAQAENLIARAASVRTPDPGVPALLADARQILDLGVNR
jgi:protein O-mannosyl-transferase